MFDIDRWQEIINTLRTNKLRTALTALGVFWGIFMLLLMLGFGNGLQHGVQKNMSGFATNSVYVWGQRTSIPHKGMQPGRRVSYNNGDVDAIRSKIDGIRYLAPRNSLGGWRSSSSVVRGLRTGGFTVMGDYPDIQHIQPMRLPMGRFLNELDMKDSRKVAVIGTTVYDELFERGEEPLGEYIRINGVYFQVVGVFKPRQTGDNGERQAQTIFIPFTAFQQSFNVGDKVGWFAINAEPTHSASKIEQQVREILAERHSISPNDRQAIGSFNAEEEFGKITTMFLGIKFFIWFVGVFTLLAGVIGVSNIMLIVVKERTKEIGIRKAIGATPLSVVTLVIQEAVVLTTMAGYLGVVAAVGLLELMSTVFGSDGLLAAPQVDLSVALIAAAILIVSGAAAGIIPAYHAARINPVEALRAE
jgi:putative ABC transport system permease protein